jgi:signal transduction histidine kinase
MVPLELSTIFLDLPLGEATDLRRAVRELEFPAGAVIFREGADGDGMYIVKEGKVEITSTLGPGKPCQLSRFVPGEHFGEMAVLDESPRSATAIADGPTVVYFIERDVLCKMLERMPGLAVRLLREISRRLRDFNHQYVREVLESERLALVGRFASSIVHDLKSPLNVISLSSEMAAMATSTPRSREISTERIRRQVERITSMVNELLEFARGSRASVVLAPVSYSDFVNQFLEEIRSEALSRGISIELENPPPDVRVRINPPRLARVLHNFVNNASDAMPTGGCIYLRFQVDGNQLLTEVRDCGGGIAPEIADRLFQAFATHGKNNGTGLGLSICKKIITDHCGRVFGRNAPQGGAIFGFTLPLEAGE